MYARKRAFIIWMKKAWLKRAFRTPFTGGDALNLTLLSQPR
jgi:hypothetical protein